MHVSSLGLERRAALTPPGMTLRLFPRSAQDELTTRFSICLCGIQIGHALSHVPQSGSFKRNQTATIADTRGKSSCRRTQETNLGGAAGGDRGPGAPVVNISRGKDTVRWRGPRARPAVHVHREEVLPRVQVVARGGCAALPLHPLCRICNRRGHLTCTHQRRVACQHFWACHPEIRAKYPELLCVKDPGRRNSGAHLHRRAVTSGVIFTCICTMHGTPVPVSGERTACVRGEGPTRGGKPPVPPQPPTGSRHPPQLPKRPMLLWHC